MHIKNAKCHAVYVQKQAEMHRVDVAATDDRIAEAGRIWRLSTVTKEDLLFRQRMLFMMLKAGIPINKCEIIRPDMEAMSLKSLGSAKDLPSDHLDMLLKGEDALQSSELVPGTLCSLICDGTSRLGEVFNVIARFICTTSTNKVVTKQLLIHLGFLRSTLDACEICGELKKAMQKRRVCPNEVIALSLDGCKANTSAHDTMEKAEDVKWLLLLCFSHMASNAGEQAGFPNLKKFWSLLQKIFPHSTAAKQIFKEVTDAAWKEYSGTCWYSEHEVYQVLFLKFQFLGTVFSKLIEQNVCTKNTLEAQGMILCPRVSLLLKIELAAYVEGLMELLKFCYCMEADGEIPFEAGAYVDKMYDIYPDQSSPHMPSVEDALIREALQFVNDNPQYQRPNVLRPQPRALREVTLAVHRPRRQRAIDAVQNAVQAIETVAQRNARLQREAEERAAAEAIYERELNEAIELEARLQADFLPQNDDEWKTHIQTGLRPAINYFFQRINNGGDRFQTYQIFKAAQLWNPMYAKMIDDESARTSLENLRFVPKLNDDELIDVLCISFPKYSTYARRNVVEKPCSILQWHFDFYRRLGEIQESDVGRCSFCNIAFNANASCSCIRLLKTWWKVAQVLGLLTPSSGASERVFSTLNSFYGNQQHGFSTRRNFCIIVLQS
jgi:hypothetical protein